MSVASWRASRVVLIGQAPGPTGPPPGRPLVGGKSGAFLQSLTGCATLRDYLRHFETTNLLDRYPGRAGKNGDRFPMVEARLAAREKLATLDRRTVIFVGLTVAEAFDWVPPVRPFDWRLFTVPGALGFKAAAIPHPSGIVPFWNDPANVERGRRFFDELLRRQSA
jgi:uracil-DNA glycosylase